MDVIQFYRRFVLEFSEIPTFRTNKEKRDGIGDKEFHKLNEAMMWAPILAAPDMRKLSRGFLDAAGLSLFMEL